MFQEKFGLGIPRAIHSKDKSPESLRPQQMGQRGMNVIDMTVDLYLSLSLGSFIIRKNKEKKNPHRMTLPWGMEYFLTGETP